MVGGGKKTHQKHTIPVVKQGGGRILVLNVQACPSKPKMMKNFTLGVVNNPKHTSKSAEECLPQRINSLKDQQYGMTQLEPRPECEGLFARKNRTIF